MYIKQTTGNRAEYRVVHHLRDTEVMTLVPTLTTRSYKVNADGDRVPQYSTIRLSWPELQAKSSATLTALRQQYPTARFYLSENRTANLIRIMQKLT